MNDIGYENFAEINLSAIQYNALTIQKEVAPAKMMCVLKGNAYGLGLVPVFRALRGIGMEEFAVANLNEALVLQEVDALCTPLVFGNIHPSRFELAQQIGIKWTIFSREQWLLLKQNLTVQIIVHIKINTGFNRLGFDIDDEDDFRCILDIADNGFVTLEGIYTHLALVNREEDEQAYNRFTEYIERLEQMDIKIPIHHVCDSISAIDYDWARMDMVRVGAALFGLRTNRPSYDKLQLRSSMRLFSTVSQVRTIKAGDGVGYDYAFKARRSKMKIATIAIGYADGYLRSLSKKKGSVLINGQLAPILGLICMDQCVVDVTNIPCVMENDLVTVYDINENSAVSVEKVAKWASTNKNEVITQLAERVPRIYETLE